MQAGVSMAVALTPRQCDTVRTFLRALVTYHNRYGAVDVTSFMQEYRKLYATQEPVRKPVNYKRFQKVCPVCGAEFIGFARSIYCSGKCNAAAFRARKRGLSYGIKQTQAGDDGI